MPTVDYLVETSCRDEGLRDRAERLVRDWAVSDGRDRLMGDCQKVLSGASPTNSDEKTIQEMLATRAQRWAPLADQDR